MARVLVSDPITAAGIDLFKEAGFEVEVKTDCTPEELQEKIKTADALIVRSQTKVTANLLDAAERLKAIGRAGVGVDNVDVETATKKGIVVLNAPDGNTLATTELTVGMILAVARNIPQAHASLKSGAWDRKKYTGIEVNRKVLGVVGMGRIGTEVSKRMLAMGMIVNAYDPFMTQAKAESIGVNLVDLDTIITESDFITVHTPLTPETKGLFGAKEFARMKKGVRVVNCARGGIYDEAALVAAIEQGQVAGAAFDVYPEEPPKSRALIDLPQVVVTPHLGASSVEAQENVAIDVAMEVIKVLKGQSFKNAVNLPTIRPEVMAAIQPYTELVQAMGQFIAQMSKGRIGKTEISYLGDISQVDTSYLSLLFIKGLLQASLEGDVTPVNAMALAKARGLKIKETKTHDVMGYANLIKVEVTTDQGVHSLTGTITENGPKVVEIEGYHFDLVPSGKLIVVSHTDQPGIIGEVGTILGVGKINIAFMQMGRKDQGGKALMVLAVDSEPDEEVLGKLKKVNSVTEATSITL